MLLVAVAVPCLALASDGLSEGVKEKGNKREVDKKEGIGVFDFNKQEPIFITSDVMVVDRKKNSITYRGRVVTAQGEMKMTSDSVVLFYDPQMKGIKEVVAEGKVHIAQGDRQATGSKAVFDGAAQTVTLTGSPVVRQGNSQISGSRIIFYIREDRAVAEGGPQRVTATIYPEELQKNMQGDGSGERRP